MIPFHQPLVTGNELTSLKEVFKNGKLSSGGNFTSQCLSFFRSEYNFEKAFLTTSATSALEAVTLLMDLQPGDEIIIPSYTFVSTCNPFLLRGCKIVFADSYAHHPNIDHTQIEKLITPRTKAIVVVHYAAMPCAMDEIMQLASRYNLKVIEDAAHAIHSFYKGKALGSIGDFGIISFHDTKNITCGEGGLLIINDPGYFQRAEIVMEKGTNRSAFLKGEKQKYEWVDIGSSYGLSEINAAVLWSQLLSVSEITRQRMELWNQYEAAFRAVAENGMFDLPAQQVNNGHIFYLVCRDEDERSRLCSHLAQHKIQAAFHYLALHQSPFYKNKYHGLPLPNADKFTTRLLRLPLYNKLNKQDINRVAHCLLTFYA